MTARRFLARALLCGVVVFASAGLSRGPLVTAGRCDNCKVSFRLGDIRFVNEREGWSTAFWWPPVTGSVESTVLHTKDGGRHWKRVPFVFERGSESGPPSSFVGQYGWIGSPDAEQGTWRLNRTNDGGNSWTHRPSDPLAQIQFFDRFRGYAVGVASGQWSFRRTADGGDTWTRSALPLSSVDLMSFADARTGVIVGASEVPKGKSRWDGVLRVLVTHDGGAAWTPAQFPVRPYAIPLMCTWIDSTNALLATMGDDDKGCELLQTNDGGLSWSGHPNRSMQGAGKTIKAIAFRPDGLGAVFHEEHAGKNIVHRYVAITGDRGRTWQTARFPRSVDSCQVMGKDIWCSSGMDVLKLDAAYLRGLVK